jgi:hypothetical protein
MGPPAPRVGPGRAIPATATLTGDTAPDADLPPGSEKFIAVWP